MQSKLDFPLQAISTGLALGIAGVFIADYANLGGTESLKTYLQPGLFLSLGLGFLNFFREQPKWLLINFVCSLWCAGELKQQSLLGNQGKKSDLPPTVLYDRELPQPKDSLPKPFQQMVKAQPVSY